MDVAKGKNWVRIGDWEISIDTDYQDKLLWVHFHAGFPHDGFGCVGDPLACRMCGTKIPEKIQMLGLLQRVRLEREE